jgi:hypothetical protein
MKKEELKFIGKNKQLFNELVDANISKVLYALFNSTDVNEIRELIHMVDILRMTRKK